MFTYGKKTINLDINFLGLSMRFKVFKVKILAVAISCGYDTCFAIRNCDGDGDLAHISGKLRQSTHRGPFPGVPSH